MPEWIRYISTISLIIGGICFLVILADILHGHQQKMWIMNLVWPITALYAGPLAVWAYWQLGRNNADEESDRSFWQSVGLSATHCGSGCSLADLSAEWALVLFPLTLFGHKIFGAWLVDYIVALGFGIAFQYFTIKPMKDISAGEAIIEALKADTLSLTSWQVGMYVWLDGYRYFCNIWP